MAGPNDMALPIGGFLTGFDGCPFEMDVNWLIMWPNTPRNTTSIQSCSGGLESLGTHVP